MAIWQTAGKVRMTPKGVYNSSTAYEILDIVSNADQTISYIAKQAVPAGTALTNTTYWTVIADVTEALENADAAISYIGDSYSSSSTYAVGDYVIHDGGLYRCTTAISTAEAWTAAHWEQVSAMDEIQDVKDEVNDLKSAIDYSFFDFASTGTFSLATISAQTGVANASTNRILLNAFIDIENIKSISTNASYSLNLFGYGDKSESSYIGTTSWTYAGTVYDKETIKTRLPTSKYIRVVFKAKNESTLTLADVVTSEFSLVLSINEKVDKNTSDIQIISESVEKSINTPYIIGSLNQIARLGWMPYAMNMPPEQSIYSYQLAYNMGCRLMLCDLRKTSDGTFVCWHDSDLGNELGNNVVKHTDGTNLSPAEKAQTIASTTIETLDTYDFGIYKGAKYAGLKILRFEDFVKFCGKLNCILVVETKYQLTETDVQNVARMIKTANLGDRVIIAEDVTYYPYTHRFWKDNLPKMIITIRGGSRAYSSAILQAKQCVDGGFESVISFTSTSGITAEMISDMVDYGISMWFSEITSESALETFETDGWLNKFKYISSSYVQIGKYVESN